MAPSRKLRCECVLTMRMVLASSSSQRAIGMPIWMISMVVLTAAASESNEQVAAITASGSG
ncbi:hypothetical protein GALL_513130 [mine drainage metagenome]|uniref:Uncharacterized protein n=1 Tax=mine drainage metagenome TaxID=410659 RepID=A0A1J5PH46_9ZZZZ